MTQTKSPAHTAQCRKVLDPTRCSCHVGAYTDQHPFICTNHQLAWHYKGRAEHAVTCEEFDAELNEVAGFTSLATDPLAVESRLFKVRQSEEVSRLTRKLRAADQDVRGWKQIAMFSGVVSLGTLAAAIGQTVGWW